MIHAVIGSRTYANTILDNSLDQSKRSQLAVELASSPNFNAGAST